MGNIFNPDFRAFLKCFNQADVKYVLVGGYSVIFHGFARNTGDLDIFVEVSAENYKAIKSAFLSFGMPMFDLTENNFLLNKSLNVFSYGVPPVSIDILKEISGLNFSEVYNESIHTVFDGEQMRIINLAHLKINTLKSGRFKDLNDLENL